MKKEYDITRLRERKIYGGIEIPSTSPLQRNIKREEDGNLKLKILLRQPIYKIRGLSRPYQDVLNTKELSEVNIYVLEIKDGIVVRKVKRNLSNLLIKSILIYGECRLLYLNGDIEEDYAEYMKYRAKTKPPRRGVEGVSVDINLNVEPVKCRDAKGEIYKYAEFEIELTLEEYEIVSKKEIQKKDILRVNMLGLGLDETGRVSIKTLVEKTPNQVN